MDNPGARGSFTTSSWSLHTPRVKSPASPARLWLVKSEPASYSWDDLVRDGRTAWTGVRNFQARNNLREMRAGETVLFYHSVTEKAIVATAKVIRLAYADPTADEGDWSCVDLAPGKALPRPVTLAAIKANPKLQECALLRLSRISVVPITPAEYAEIMRMAK